MKLFKILVASLLCFNLSGCLDELSSSDSDTDSSLLDSGSSGGGGSDGAGSGGGGSAGSYDYSYTCGAQSAPSVVPIPKGNCESQYKTFAKVFGCNDVYNMNTAACNLEKCSGQKMGCGSF